MSFAAEVIPILHHDEHYVVVNKPAGLLVHRTSVDAREPRFLLQTLREQIGCRVHPIHRLDKGTSGIVVFALHAEAANRLSRAFREDRVDKHYVAVVRGYAPKQVVVDWPLRDPIDPRATQRNTALRPAVTEVRRLAIAELSTAVGRYTTARYSLVACRPRSGRRHQIRRHLKHLRHPVIGDANYGDLVHNRFFRNTLGVGRLLLAATGIGFEHPYAKTELRIGAPLDECFRRLFQQLGWATTEVEVLLHHAPTVPRPPDPGGRSENAQDGNVRQRQPR
jgi:tRNA pseudouridine65 synthase